MNPKPPLKLGIALAAAVLLAFSPVALAEQFNIQTATLGQNQKTAEVSTEELRRILVDGNATVFDARPFMEFSSGHIPGAVNVSAKAGMPMSLYVSDVAEIERILHGDKGGAIVLYAMARLREEQPSGRRTYPSRLHEYPTLPIGRPSLAGARWGDADRGSGVPVLREGDHTARTYDTRPAADFAAGTLPGAIHLPTDEVEKAKNDGRLPMEDHNTRIVVFGSTAMQARSTAETIAKNAFYNVMFCADAFCKQQVASK